MRHEPCANHPWLKDENLNGAAKDFEDGPKLVSALTSLWLSGTKEGAHFCGGEAQCLPHIRLQARPRETKKHGNTAFQIEKMFMQTNILSSIFLKLYIFFFQHLADAQITGGKLLIVVCAREAASFFGTESLQEIRSRLLGMQAKDFPTLDCPSLQAIYVRTGDLVFIPAGYLVAEKIVYDNDVGLRQVQFYWRKCFTKFFFLLELSVLSEFNIISCDCDR